MTKKLIALCLLCVCLLLPLSPALTSAESTPEERETFEDGDYIVFVLKDGAADTQNENTLSVLSRLMELLRAFFRLFTGTKTVTKTKYVNYYDKYGTLLWTVSLEASFSYSKNGAKCESAKLSSVFYDADWKLISAETDQEGATASGHFTVRQTKLGVGLKTVERTVTLTCDTNGNVI